MAEAELPIVRLRHWGRWIAAAVIVALLVLLGIALGNAQIEWRQVPDFVLYRVMATGLLNTVVLAVLSQGVAIVLGVVIALLRRSANPVARWFAAGYIWIFRGLPVLLQILLWYNLALVFPVISVPFLVHEQTNVLISAFTAAFLGLALNESAYMAEIVRAGLTSVDSGQTEAAKSIGMTPAATLRRVVLPQAMRVIIPPTGNETIAMLKTTSLVVVIGYFELMVAVQQIYAQNYKIIPLLLTAAVWYLFMTSILTLIQMQIEKRFSRGSSKGIADQAKWRSRMLGFRFGTGGGGAGAGGATA